MKFAIIGAGVAGSYLGNILHNNGHDVTIYEAYPKEKHWPVCAWGASRHMLEHFFSKSRFRIQRLHTTYWQKT